MDEVVVVPFSVPEAVTLVVEGNAWHEHQVHLAREVEPRQAVNNVRPLSTQQGGNRARAVESLSTARCQPCTRKLALKRNTFSNFP